MIVAFLTMKVSIHPIPSHWQGKVLLELLRLDASNLGATKVRKDIDEIS